MRRAVAAALAALAMAATAGAVRAQSADGATVFQQACSQCHGPGEIYLQRKPAEGWRRTVYAMVSRGAIVRASELEPLVQDLTANFGPDSPPPKAAGVTAASGDPAMALVQARCSSCHALAVVTGARKPEAAWRATIDRMVAKHAAKVTDAERDQIAAYLGRLAN